MNDESINQIRSDQTERTKKKVEKLPCMPHSHAVCTKKVKVKEEEVSEEYVFSPISPPTLPPTALPPFFLLHLSSCPSTPAFPAPDPPHLPTLLLPLDLSYSFSFPLPTSLPPCTPPTPPMQPSSTPTLHTDSTFPPREAPTRPLNDIPSFASQTTAR